LFFCGRLAGHPPPAEDGRAGRLVGWNVDLILVVLDLVGTFAFALSGALVGVRRRLDLFGVLVLSIVAATGGGIMRDTLVGATPPAALQDWRYVALSVLAGLLTFRAADLIERWRNPVQSLDAVGLGGDRKSGV